MVVPWAQALWEQQIWRAPVLLLLTLWEDGEAEVALGPGAEGVK